MQDNQQEPIAIIGMGCRFPKAHNPQEFWTLLYESKDAIQEVPADRWDIQRLYDPDAAVPGKMVSRWGGFLDQIDQFDWKAFRMLPREATSMDPQHRLLLEVAWEALEDAGLPFEEVAGSQTSVSIGIGWSDYLRLQARNWSQLNEYTAIGNANSFAANRLSYLFDLKGPSVSVDTGCTSSLTALYLACQSLWAGEAQLALVGGVSLTLSPDSMIMLSKSDLLSPDGRCKTLDANADGFVRGEGAGVIVLKPLSQVRRSDRVYALIRGTAVNHNGHNEWIIAASQKAQETLLRDAYRKAGIHPASVDYVELHGTGFQRGDTIETKALGAVLGSCPERTHSCLVGSVKTNIGHLDTASGIASVIKVALSLYHRHIPATLNLQTVNPDIPLDDLHLAVPQTGIPWPEKVPCTTDSGQEPCTVPTTPQTAGVTALAFNGANAHTVLTAYPDTVNGEKGREPCAVSTAPFPREHEQEDEGVCRLLPLSARSEQALYGLAEAYRDFLTQVQAPQQADAAPRPPDTTPAWRDICYSASVRRTHHSYRLAVLGRTPQEAADALHVYLQKHHRESGAEGGKQRQDQILSTFLASEQEEEGPSPTHLAALSKLYTSGGKVNWSELYQGEDCHCVSLPLYAWQRERLWPDWLDVEKISTPPEEYSAALHTKGRDGDSARLQPIETSGREVVEVLTELWADVLGLEKVNSFASFFELGGHSLLAQRLLVRIRDVFQVELALKDLLKAPRPADCAELIGQAQGTAPTMMGIQGTAPTTMGIQGTAPTMMGIQGTAPTTMGVQGTAPTGGASGQARGADSTRVASQTNFDGVASSLLPLEPDSKQRYEPFPTTDVQQAYWVGRHTAFEIGNVGNHGYIEVEATDLDLDRFKRALQRLIERHDMLRAVLLPDGQQQILEQVPPFEIKIADLRGQDREAQVSRLEQMRQTLDHQVLPVEQWPAFELWVSRLDERQVRLHLSIESLFVDAWSMNTLIHEFIRLYHEPDLALPSPTLSFRDYVLAEASLHTGAQYQRAQEYWLARLSSLPPAPDLPLLSESERTFQQPQFVHREARLEREHWQLLKTHAAKIGVTPSGVLLTAFAEVIAAWSKTVRFSLNLSTFNRLPLHPEVNDIVGDFTSLLVLAVDHTHPASFEERAKRIQEQLWNDLDHSSYSGIQVLRELVKMQGEGLKAVMPIVFTSLLIQDTASSLPPPWGKTLYCVSQTPQVWLDHQVLESGGDLVLHWQSVDAIFPAGLIDAMFAAYCQLLQHLALGTGQAQTGRDKPLPLRVPTAPARGFLPEQQRILMVEVNATEAPVTDKLLHTFFHEQVMQRPTQPAVISPIRLLSYQEVYSGALQLAHQLREWGARPNQLVGVVMEKGWEQVVAVLGILQSGAAYLPIDASLPGERLQFLLADGQVKVVLTQSWIDKWTEWPQDVKRICVDSLDLGKEDIPELVSVQSPDDLAYVIYTSGSTGRPKGVMIDHRGAVNTILDINKRFSVNSNDRVFALSALNFDLSVYDIFGILTAGGTIVLPPEGSLRDPAIWINLLVQEQVTVWNTVPALLQMLVDYTDTSPEILRQTSLRLALLSGDWIPVPLPGRVKEHMPDIQVISLGGATEASIWSILYPIHTIEPSWRSIPYGKPMDNQRFFVLNDTLEPCPVWVPGHLYIGGIGLAKGYWRDEEKTQASFFQHPRTGERLYRAGDLGRYLPDGNIEFLGREDFQVKVQGHRIELGEIEETLLQHSAVRTAVATAITEPHGDKRLVAYVVLQSGQEISANGQHTSDHVVDETPPQGYSLAQLKGPSPIGNGRNGSYSHGSHEGSNQHETLQHLASGFGQTSIRKDIDKLVGIVPHANGSEHGVGTRHRIGASPILPYIATPMIDLKHATDNSDILRKYRERLSYRRFLQEPIPFKQFSAFLSSLSQIELEGLPKYRYPSAGGIYPVQTYVSIKAQCVEGIPEGIYYFNPQSAQLVMLSGNGHLNPSIHGAINQPIFAESAFSLFLVGDLTTISSVYGDAARDFCLLEAGYMSQLLMMTGAEQHIGLCPVGGVDFEQIRDLFVLQESHLLLHTLLCGRVDPSVATGWSFLPGNTQNAAPLLPAQPATTSVVTSTTLHSFLKEKLPEYMIPSAIMMLDSLPLTPNGKVDRKNLPAPEIQSSRKETEYREPTSEIEQTIAAVWQEFLPSKKVGIHDNFFDLGGNSMLMVRAYTRLRKVLRDRPTNGARHTGNDRDLSIIEMFFQYPTIHALAEFLTQGVGQQVQSSPEDAPEQQRRVERRNVSLQQERLARLRHRTIERNQEDA